MNPKNIKKFIIQLGMGVDQHGQDVTNAAQKAIKDAISIECLVSLTDICNLKDLKDFFVHIQVAVPYTEQTNEKRLGKRISLLGFTSNIFPRARFLQNLQRM